MSATSRRTRRRRLNEGEETGRSLPKFNVLALYYEIMPDTENLRLRAYRLLLLAQKAREEDCMKLAEYITDRATQLYDEAIILERRSAQRVSPPEAA
jgi:hypothetical protein